MNEIARAVRFFCHAAGGGRCPLDLAQREARLERRVYAFARRTADGSSYRRHGRARAPRPQGDCDLAFPHRNQRRMDDREPSLARLIIPAYRKNVNDRKRFNTNL